MNLEEGTTAGVEIRELYLGKVTELLSICRSLSVKWEEKSVQGIK